METIPPLTTADWMETFQLYKQTPEFKLKNYDFTLSEFKSIFWWEYVHRMIGRFIGVVFLLPFIYFIIQCFIKGFSLSLISFMKWVLSTIVTIILVPKLQPTVSDYIESDFINSVGIGVVVFVLTLFITIVIGKTLSRAVTWTGVGSIDKTFGLLFGFFKGYIVTVCLFSILNWFYP